MSQYSNEKKPASRLRFDTVAIESAARAYPANLQEDVIWLGNFVRESCGSNLNVLVATCKKIHISKSRNYFYQVLVGCYQKKGVFNGSEENFRELVSKLRSEYILHRRDEEKPFIETDTWHLQRNYIDDKRSPLCINKFGLILGPTGAQKTACLKHYIQLPENAGLCIHVEAPETPTLGKFYTDVARHFGAGLNWVMGKKYQYILASVDKRKVLIVDNIQRLYNAKEQGNQPIFHFLQKLQEDTGCTIILCATPEFQNTMMGALAVGFFEQFIGRIGGVEEFLVLPAYVSEDDLVQIARAANVATDKATIAFLKTVSQRPGRIRILFGVLQQARADVGPDETITLDILKEIAGPKKEAK